MVEDPTPDDECEEAAERQGDHPRFEKLGEHLDYNQYVTIVSRMDYVSPISNDICWHEAVERLFGIDITPRCKVIRTIMAELGRIQNHLLSKTERAES